MQHRYKINTSAEARKSSANNTQTHKNDSLSYINLLDKCTQILREDRIWIRNQLKANDEDIFKIFKQAKRPINLQHLQIRLRKHVTAVKSKAKMEQLMKFKQNMHMGDWITTEEKPAAQPRKQSSTKYQLPANLQSINNQSRGMKARMNNSVDKHSKSSNSIFPYRNTSANSKKVQPYPGPMEQITQRQSENMTSARNRVFGDESGHDNFPLGHTYQQWRRPQTQTNVTPTSLSSNYIQDPFKPKSQNSYFNNFIESETKPKQNLSIPEAPKYQASTAPLRNPISSAAHQAKNEMSTNSHLGKKTFQQNNKMEREKHEDREGDYSPQILQKNDYSNCSNLNNLNEEHYSQDHGNSSQIISNSYLEEYSPNAYKPQSQNLPSNSNFLDSLNSNSRLADQPKYIQNNIQRDFTYNQTFKNDLMKPTPISNLEQTDLLHSKNSILPFSSNSNNDSLFTSPELLAECRNFLKLKSSAKPSVEKDFTNSRLTVEKQTKFEPLKFDSFDPLKIETKMQNKKEMSHYSNSESSMMHLLNEINCGMAQSMSQPHENLSYQQSSLSFSQPAFVPTKAPVQALEDKKMTGQVPKQTSKPYGTDKTEALHEYFHTFAGLSSHKKIEEPQITTPQAFVNLVFQNISNEPEGFVYWSTLQKLVERRVPQFMDSFKQYLLPADDQKLVLLSNIGRLLEDLMSDQRQQQSENEARNIYRLLDIEQKGYIVEQDIEDFIHQLEDSEASDIEIISQCIWKLFQTIDEDAQEGEAKRIDYWGIYSKKNSAQFQELNEILKQFQFQIE